MLYCRPDESFLYGTVAGTVDATYEADWLLDGRPGYPVRKTSGGLSLTCTSLAPRTLSVIAAINHNISGTIGITGDTTQTIPAATLGEDGIYFNSFKRFTPVATADDIVMAAAGTPAIVGLLYAGTARDLERDLSADDSGFDEAEPFAWEGEHGLVPPHDPGVSDPRRLTGSVVMSGTGLAEIRAWYLSTRKGARPSLFVPFESVNDAWLVRFKYRVKPLKVNETTAALSTYLVTFDILEIPRLRWPA